MNIKWLKYLIAIAAVLIAGSAAYFSVTGLGVLFSGAAIAVMIMAGSLEFAKLVTATYLKQKWAEIKGVNKWYLTIAVVILMTITSAGIFGYLSNAFQQQNIKLQQVQREIDVWNNKIKLTNDQIVTLNSQVNNLNDLQKTIGNKSSNTAIKSLDKRDIKTTKLTDRINSLQDSIVIYNGKINDVKNNNIGIEREVGGFRFVAEAFNVSLNSVVKFFIILIVIVFDPLAISLVIAFNQLILDKTPENKTTTDTIAEDEIPLILSKKDLEIIEKHLLSKTPVDPNENLKEAAKDYNEKVNQKPWSNLPDEVWEKMQKYEAQREALHGPILPEDEPTGALANSEYREQFAEMTIQEDNNRMDIIGQNGNEGLHYDLEEPVSDTETIQDEPTLDEEEENYSNMPPILDNELHEDIKIVEITHNATTLDGFTPIPYGEEILEPIEDFGIDLEEEKELKNINQIMTEIENENFSKEPTKLDEEYKLEKPENIYVELPSESTDEEKKNS